MSVASGAGIGAGAGAGAGAASVASGVGAGTGAFTVLSVRPSAQARAELARNRQREAIMFKAEAAEVIAHARTQAVQE